MEPFILFVCCQNSVAAKFLCIFYIDYVRRVVILCVKCFPWNVDAKNFNVRITYADDAVCEKKRDKRFCFYFLLTCFQFVLSRDTRSSRNVKHVREKRVSTSSPTARLICIILRMLCVGIDIAKNWCRLETRGHHMVWYDSDVYLLSNFRASQSTHSRDRPCTYHRLNILANET